MLVPTPISQLFNSPLPIEQQGCQIQAKRVVHKEPTSTDELLVVEFPNERAIRQLDELELEM